MDTKHTPPGDAARAPRRLRRFARRAAWTLLGVASLTAAFGTWRVRRAWPVVEGTETLAGIQSSTRIVRDAHGVPQIYAANEHDLFFAQGYAHAQDRLWQMELGRLAASGRLSSYLGKATLDVDRLSRVIGLRAAAERDWSAAASEERAIVEAYVAGINAFLDANRSRLPVEFSMLNVDVEPWSPVDSLAFSQLVSLNLGENFWVELMRAHLGEKVGASSALALMPGAPEEGPFILAPGATGSFAVPAATKRWMPLLAAPGRAWGSNSWVVSGSRTRSGKPILANDTHLDLAQPSPWYENGLHGGRFDVAGFSMPGMPLVVIGRNAQISWGITNMCSDVQDLFVEKLDAQLPPKTFESRGEWFPLETTHQAIAVRGSDPVDLTITRTKHGPLLNSAIDSLKDSPPVALRWASVEGNRLLHALVELDAARDWGSFRSALQYWDAPTLNFVYADTDGNIGYQAAGRIPMRPKTQSGLVPASGSSGDAEWLGYVPFESLPTRFNPSEGFIVTANNKVVPDGEYSLARECVADPFRAKRITQMLADKPKVALEDVEEMQRDTFSLAADGLVPLLVGVTPKTPLETGALKELTSWNRRYETESAGATVFEPYYRLIVQNTFSDELGGGEVADEYLGAAFAHERVMKELLTQPNADWFDDRRTPQRETRDDILQRSFSEAVLWAQDRLGNDPSLWAWGRIHRVTLGHVPFGQVPVLSRLFNGPDLPARGASFTVDVGEADLVDPFEMSFGVSQRWIVDFADDGRALAINSTGQSGLLFHSHADDEVQEWLNGEYEPLSIREDDIRATSKDVLTLVSPVRGSRK